MGLFSSLKKNLSHGGVKLNLNAPGSISMTEGEVPVSVEVMATDSPATINSVSVELTRETPPGVSQDGTQDSLTPRQSMSSAQSTEKFNLQPGQSKVVDVKLVVNLGNALQDMTDNPGAKSLAKGLGALQELADHARTGNYDYFITANAAVEGLKLQPGVNQPVQLVKPGEFGTAINIKR